MKLNSKKISALALSLAIVAGTIFPTTVCSASSPAYSVETDKKLASVSQSELSNDIATPLEYGHVNDFSKPVYASTDISVNDVEQSFECITNGDFEEDITGNWQINQDTSWVASTDAPSGAKAGYVGPWSMGLQTVGMTFIKDHEYTLSFKYKAGAAGATVRIGSGGWYAGDILATTALEAADSWTSKEFEVTATANSDAILLFENMQGGGLCYFDTVSIIDNTAEYDANNVEVLTNGGFEGGGTNWEYINIGNNCFDFDNGPAKGERCLAMFSGSVAQYENINLVAGKEYTLSFYYKIAGTAEVCIGTGWYMDDVLSRITLQSTEGQWIKYTKTFTSEYTGSAIILLDNWMSGRDCGLNYFDEVALTTTEYPQPSANCKVNVLVANTSAEGKYVGLQMNYTTGWRLALMNVAGEVESYLTGAAKYPNSNTNNISENTNVTVVTENGELTVYLNDTAVVNNFSSGDFEIISPAVGVCVSEDVIYSIDASVWTAIDNYEFLGDLNGDMNVNLLDLVRAKKIMAGSADAFNKNVLAFATDYEMDSKALVSLRKYLLGDETALTLVMVSIDLVDVESIF